MTSQGQICRSFVVEKYKKFNFTRFLREIDQSEPLIPIDNFILRSGKVFRLIDFPQEARKVEDPIIFHYKSDTNLPLCRHQFTTLWLNISGTNDF